MRYFVFADVHGNFSALKAVLSARKREAIDRTIFLGDLVGYGPNPNEVIELLQNNKINFSIRGNHDDAIAETLPLHNFESLARFSILWTRNEITIENREFIRKIDRPPLRINDDILICHASPQNNDRYILTKRDAKNTFRKMENWITLFAHTHIAAMHTLNEKQISISYPEVDFIYPLSRSKRYLINPGAVGQPRDLDSRASYAILDTGEKTIHFQRVEYDIKKTQDQIREADLPIWHANRLGVGK